VRVRVRVDGGEGEEETLILTPTHPLSHLPPTPTPAPCPFCPSFSPTQAKFGHWSKNYGCTAVMLLLLYWDWN
jgi:hypothetical protein